MTLAIGDIILSGRVVLAPMSGVTDHGMRRIARRFGASLVVSEMVASDSFVNGHEETRLRAEGTGINPHVVQLAGRDPFWMSEAARLAEASGAVVIGFNVRANKEARDAAERAGIEIRYYNIIYDLVDDIKKAMSGLLAPTLREERLGEARILQVFAVSKVGKVAGCLVQDGRVERGAHVRLIRDNVVIHEGKLSTLKRFKDEVKEVQSGQECGMAFENYQDMREGDIIECYRVEEIRRSL
jgi:hypothetical protein